MDRYNSIAIIQFKCQDFFANNSLKEAVNISNVLERTTTIDAPNSQTESFYHVLTIEQINNFT